MSKKWKELSKKTFEITQRAAQLQAQQRGISSPELIEKEISHYIDICNIPAKNQNWKDFGDIAFILTTCYPPDLAYLLIYFFREKKEEIGYDPVPFIFKAIEYIYYINPFYWPIIINNKEKNYEFEQCISNPEFRAIKGAKILCREICINYLYWASNILNDMNKKMKIHFLSELEKFNPTAKNILMKSKFYSLFSIKGIIRNILRLLFGKI